MRPRPIVISLLVLLAGVAVGLYEARTEYFREMKRDVVNFALKVWYTFFDPLVQRIQEARRAPTKAPNDRVILVPRSAGPVVESPDLKYPMPLSFVPIRSTKAKAKRDALEYARQITGNPGLPWKSARKLLNRLDREGRAIARKELQT